VAEILGGLSVAAGARLIRASASKSKPGHWFVVEGRRWLAAPPDAPPLSPAPAAPAAARAAAAAEPEITPAELIAIAGAELARPALPPGLRRHWQRLADEARRCLERTDSGGAAVSQTPDE